MARTKQTARKSRRTGEQPQVEAETRTKLLQLMGLPKEGSASALTAPADWPAVVKRLESHPEEASLEDKLDTGPFGHWHIGRWHREKHPLLVALANERNPLTKEAFDALYEAFPDVVLKPRSTVMFVALQNSALCDERPEIIDALMKASPYFCGRQRTRTFQLMGYPRLWSEGPPPHHTNDFRGGGYHVDWQAIENHLQEHPEEAKILCPTSTHEAIPLFPLEAALEFRYPPIPISTVRLLLRLCPEAATVPDSCALSAACCFAPSIYPNTDPEVVRAILEANPEMAQASGLHCCTCHYEEQQGLPLHTLVYFMPDQGADVVSNLIQAYPDALSSYDTHIYNYIPLQVATERDKLCTDTLKILLENGHRYNVGGGESGLGQMFTREGTSIDIGNSTAMANLIERFFLDRYSWETGRDMRSWDNLCLGLKAAGAYKTGLSAETMWEYPILQAAIEFSTRQTIVESILQNPSTTPEDLNREDALGRTPLAVAIEMAGSNHDDDDPDNICFNSVLEMLLNDEEHGSSQSAARINRNGRLPLHHALHRGVGLEDGTKHLLRAYPAAVSVTDPETKLLPCLLAAVGEKARINTIFGLMIQRPNLIATLCKLNSG